MTTATMTKQELVAECESRGIEVPEKATKDVLLDLIHKHDTAYEARDTAGTSTDEVVDGEVVEVVEVDEDGAVQSMEIAVRDEREHAPHPAAVLPSPGEWEATMTMAQTIANTPFVPASYRGQPEAVVAAILYGREIGIGPMQALRQINMIDGRPALSAELMMAQMRRGGVVVVASEATPTRAFIRARRTDTGEEAEVEWTAEEAKAAGLTGKKNWTAYPVDMLWARCVGRLARRLGSDLLGGMVYAAEEMQDWDDGGYGGSGYDTPAAQPGKPAGKPVVTSKGVEARADAPKSWTAVAEELNRIDGTGGSGWTDWVEQAIHALTGKHKVAELAAGDEYRDTLILVANGVANLAEAMAGREFPPPTRKEVQDAFAHANSVDHRLLGPDGPMDPDEAAMMKAAQDGRTGTGPGGAETAPDAQEDAPAGNQPSDVEKPADGLLGTTAEVDEDTLPGFGEESDAD